MRASASAKGSTGADYQSSNHVSHTVSNNVSNYLTPEAKRAFNQLRQAFTEAPIIQHFDLERYIQVWTDASGYAIGRVLSQLTNDLDRWHPVAYFSRKIIPAKTRYETYNSEFSAIVEAFKTWRHYRKGCKHKVLVLIDHNNLQQFMDTKNLSSCQVNCAQQLSRYHFWIVYRQGKANRAGDALSRFLKRDNKEKANLWAENNQILHYLQFSMTNASISGLNTTFSGFSPQHQVLISGTSALPQLRCFWSTLQTKLVNERLYKVSIGSMNLKLQKL